MILFELVTMTEINLLVAVILFIFVCRLIWRERSKPRIPPGVQPLPGPKGYPIVGLLHEISTSLSWLKFHEWGKKYGSIYQIEILGTVHVWISSEQVANDLLSRRASIYSDRPQIPNLPDNRVKGDYLALTGCNDVWKRQRKLAQQLMSANTSLHDYPSKERDRFLYLFSTDPSQYREFIEQFTSRTVARLAWGSPHSAKKLRITTAGLLETISPSGALPNLIPWLMHLPVSLSPWQQNENARHAMEAKLLRDSLKYAHDRITEGTAKPSFIKTFIERTGLAGSKSSSIEEPEASYVIGQMAIAGALTIGSPIQSFLMAMLHYPDWQRKLQDEIDRVCLGACPQWEDREKLPMLRAVVKEVIRWRPPVPTGIPHALEKDDIYNGYFIPGGATIHALEWAITRNESMYPDGDTFNPARWLEPKYPTFREPLTVHPNLNGFSQFGFGRRTCQGIPLVEQDLYLAMGGIAWAFDLRKKKKKRAAGGDDEVPVHWYDYTPLLISKPMPFEFDAFVRGKEKKLMLRRMWDSGKGEDDKDIDDERGEGTILKKAGGDEHLGEKGAVKENIGIRTITIDDVLSDRGSETTAQTQSAASSDTSSSYPDSDGSVSDGRILIQLD